MRELILDPIIFIPLAGLSVAIFLCLFQYFRNERQYFIEDIAVSIFFILTFPLTIPVFAYVQVSSLGGVDKTLASAAIQLSIYVSILTLARSGFKNAVRNVISGLFSCPLLAFLIVMSLLSGLWSQTPWITFRYSLTILFTSCLAVHVAYRYSWRRFYILLRRSFTAVVLVSFIVILVFPSIGVGGKGWTGIINHPIGLGSLAALNTSLWVADIDLHKKNWWIRTPVMAISALEVVCSNSAGALIILITSLSLITWIKLTEKLPKKYFVVIFGATIVVSILLYVAITSNFVEILNFLGKDPTLTGRTEFWNQLVGRIERQPFLGYGIYGFWQSWRGAEDPASGIILANEFIPTHAHNGYFETTLSLGLTGLALLTSSHISNLLRILQSLGQPSRIPGLLLGTILFMYTILFNISSPGFLDATYIWFLYVYITIRFSVDRKTLDELLLSKMSAVKARGL